MSFLREVFRRFNSANKEDGPKQLRYSSYVEKQGSNFKNWKRRFMVLGDQKMYYYKQKDMRDCLNSFLVRGGEWDVARNVLRGMEPVEHCLWVSKPNGEKFYFCTDDEKTLMEWKMVLTEVGCHQVLSKEETMIPKVFVYRIRNQAQKLASIRERLKKACKKGIKLEIDWKSFAENELIKRNHIKSVVRCLFEYLDFLTIAIEKSCQGELERNEFNTAIFRSIIKVTLDDTITANFGYHDLNIENGCLVLKSGATKFWGNSHTVGSNLEQLYTSNTDVLPLAIRKSIRDASRLHQEAEERCESFTGKKYEIEVMWEKIANCGSIYPNEHPKVAQIVYTLYFNTLFENMKKVFSSMPSIKEKFNEAVFKRKIILSVASLALVKADISVDDGVLYILISEQSWNFSCPSLFMNISEKLPSEPIIKNKSKESNGSQNQGKVVVEKDNEEQESTETISDAKDEDSTVEHPKEPVEEVTEDSAVEQVTEESNEEITSIAKSNEPNEEVTEESNEPNEEPEEEGTEESEEQVEDITDESNEPNEEVPEDPNEPNEEATEESNKLVEEKASTEESNEPVEDESNEPAEEVADESNEPEVTDDSNELVEEVTDESNEPAEEIASSEECNEVKDDQSLDEPCENTANSNE